MNGGQLVGDARLHPLDRGVPTGEQGVGVPTLGDTSSGSGPVGHGVPFDDDDLVVRVGQRVGREQPSHAPSEHDRSIPGLRGAISVTHPLRLPPCTEETAVTGR